jgi:hypothetical protein
VRRAIRQASLLVPVCLIRGTDFPGLDASHCPLMRPAAADINALRVPACNCGQSGLLRKPSGSRALIYGGLIIEPSPEFPCSSTHVTWEFILDLSPVPALGRQSFNAMRIISVEVPKQPNDGQDMDCIIETSSLTIE